MLLSESPSHIRDSISINPLNAEVNPTCHLLAVLEAHHILHVSRIRVNMDACSVFLIVLFYCTCLLHTELLHAVSGS